MTRTTDATPAQASGTTPTEAMFAADEASRSLGIELLEHGAGIIAMAMQRMTVTPAMVKEHETAHGGCPFLLADTACTCACESRSGIYDVSIPRGAEVIAEFRGRSRSICGTTTKESP